MLKSVQLRRLLKQVRLKFSFGGIALWAKRNCFVPIVLTLLFSSLIFQASKSVDGICANYGWKFCTSVLDYHLIDIHLDQIEHQFGFVQEGESSGEILIEIDSDTESVQQLRAILANPAIDDLFVFRIAGTGKINDYGSNNFDYYSDDEYMHLEIGERADIPGANKPFVLSIQAGKHETYENIVIHFPSNDPNSGFDDFNSAPANCCESHFKFLTHVRLVGFREKMQMGFISQFKAKRHQPTGKVANHIQTQLSNGLRVNEFFVDP